MRIAVLEASHWHVPMVAEGLIAAGAEVVALCDVDPTVREALAQRLGARAYADAATLLQRETPDFVFVFGQHHVLAELAQRVIARGIPCSVEKPGGLDAQQVRRLRDAAGRKFVAVPFVQRVGPLFAYLERLRVEENVRFAHASWRFFAGPPQRYRRFGTPWMLDPQRSGGGCLINLAPHFIDLALHMLGEPVQVTGATCAAHLHGEAVEDYAEVSLKSARGTAVVQTGYCFPDHPDKREYAFSLAAPTHYVNSAAHGITLRTADGATREIAMDLDSDPLYGIYARRCLDDAAAGRPPVAGLGHLLAAMRVIDAAYALARA
jgi:predicted dehydrogenase